MSIDDEPRTEGKDRLVVHTKQEHGGGPTGSCTRDSVVLFLVIRCPVKAPYSREFFELIAEARKLVENTQTALFPTFAGCPPQHFDQHVTQQTRPVIDGFLPSSYDTTKPRTAAVMMDNFGRKYEPVKCTAKANPWSIYADVALPRDSTGEFDVEKLMTAPYEALGRGGFGVAVPIKGRLVAKTNLFPEMLNWSVPFVDDEFDRYAHIASQVEEVMIGVSIKHPNILRTFGGFWCDIPGYQLGGRAVLVAERAICTLQEFVFRIKGGATIAPAVELDTLRGLDYLRSRTIQHRDFTARNVLVCRQQDRKPVPFAFKISDFGTSCNFSTPDQPRGNHTAMAPEVLWCLNAATGSDVFSWYCAMWELHSGLPLIGYKGSGLSYCRKTYADNLSNLVGVYSPEKDATFELGYMEAIDARALHAKHKDRRPKAQTIQDTLRRAGLSVADKNFVSMGVLCITLFPQERWSPAELLNLARYRCLSHDISAARLPSKQTMPLFVRVGEYTPTDIIVSDDCVPEGLAKLVTERSAAGSPVTVIKSDTKVYYGVDLMRLAPGLIQPYGWYSKKVKELEDAYKSKYKKRKAGDDDDDDDNPVEVRRSKTAPGVYAAAAAERTTSQRVNGRIPHDGAGHVSAEAFLFERSVDAAGDELLCGGDSELSRASDSNRALAATADGRVGSSVDALTRDEAPVTDNAVSVEESPTKPPSDSTDEPEPEPQPEPADPVPEASDEPRGTVILRGRKIEGEMDTTVVILKSHNEKEIARFKDNIVSLSQSITQMHPLIFAGPRDSLCMCSRSNGVFFFQYAQLFEGHKQVFNWTASDPPYSVRAFLLQVFLTLKAALDVKLLPTRMTEWRDVLIAKGAVMIDIMQYLCRNFAEPRSTMFGEQCESLVGLCAAMVAKHLPDSKLHEWLTGLRSETSASCVLTKSIEWLRYHGLGGERKTPYLSTLRGNFFTFKDYSSDVPNWLTSAGEEEAEEARNRSNAKLLVYGDPKPFRGNQMTESVGDSKLNTLVRNIVLRLRVKIFKSSRLEVTTLDCTQGLTKVTLNNSALRGVYSVDQLDRSTLPDSSCGFVHDAVSLTESKWAPVIMFTKFERPGPVHEFNVIYYTMTILVVLLSSQGSVRSLRDLFQSLATFSVTEY